MSLTPPEKHALAGIVRASLASAVETNRLGQYSPENPNLPSLSEKCGCFVTLKTDGHLRGCIGCFTSNHPLYQTAAEYAAISALEDPRFTHNRLTPKELPRVEVEISILSPLTPCQDPENIILGTHGIYVQQGRHSGCFLPQVASETGWSIPEFWSHCCHDKAGLPADVWQSPQTSLFTFTAEVLTL